MKRNIFVLFLHWIRLIKIVSKQSKGERLIYEPQTHCSKKLKVFVKDFFINSDQIGSFPRIWSHSLKNFLMEKFIFCAVFQMSHLSVLTLFYYEDWNMLMDIFYSHLFCNSCVINKSYSELLSFIADPHLKPLFCYCILQS